MEHFSVQVVRMIIVFQQKQGKSYSFSLFLLLWIEQTQLICGILMQRMLKRFGKV